MKKKIYILIKNKPTKTILEIIEQINKKNEVNIYDLRKNKDYDLIVDDIFRHDKVICC